MNKKLQVNNLELRIHKCEEIVQNCTVIPSFSYSEYWAKKKLLNSYRDNARRKLDALKQTSPSQWQTQYNETKRLVDTVQEMAKEFIKSHTYTTNL